MTDCPECGGEGSYDSEIRCSGSCDWCGGCVDAICCDLCKGSGEVDYETAFDWSEEQRHRLERLLKLERKKRAA
jgi:hypothetical protein